MPGTIANLDLSKLVIKTGSLIVPEEGNLKASSPKGIIDVRLAQYNAIDKDGDRFLPGSVHNWKDGKLLFSHWQHDHRQIPHGTGVHYDANGWACATCTLLMEFPVVQQEYAVMEAMGPSQEFSWAFLPEEYHWRTDGDGIEWAKVYIYEVSPVYIGAGNGTGIISIKAESPLSRNSLDGREAIIQELKSSKSYSVPKEIFLVEAITMPEETPVLTAEETPVLPPDLTKGWQSDLLAFLQSQAKATDDLQKRLDEMQSVEATPPTQTVSIVAANTPESMPTVPRYKSWPTVAPAFDKNFNGTDYILKAIMEDDHFVRTAISGSARDGVTVRIPGSLELMKAALTSTSLIAHGPLVALMQEDPELLDYMVFVDAGPGQTYRQRVQASVTASMTAPSATPTSSGAAVTPTDLPLRQLRGIQEIDNLVLETDANVLFETAASAVMALRVELCKQIFNGDGTGQNLKGFSSFLTGTNAVAVAASAKILSDSTSGMNKTIMGIRSAGATANLIAAEEDEAGLIYDSLIQQRSPFPSTQENPYGSPMRARNTPYNGLTNDTLYVVSLGNPKYHVIAIRPTLEIEYDPVSNRSKNETLIHATMYIANSVPNPKAHKKFTAANNFVVES